MNFATCIANKYRDSVEERGLLRLCVCVNDVMFVCGDYFCAELGCVVSVILWLCASIGWQMCELSL